MEHAPEADENCSACRVAPRNRSAFKAGSGCYTCKDCGKRTRETGFGEAELELCRSCFGDAGDENTHNDEHYGQMRDLSCRFCRAANDSDHRLASQMPNPEKPAPFIRTITESDMGGTCNVADCVAAHAYALIVPMHPGPYMLRFCADHIASIRDAATEVLS